MEQNELIKLILETALIGYVAISLCCVIEYGSFLLREERGFKSTIHRTFFFMLAFLFWPAVLLYANSTNRERKDKP